jgi:hypothetical protein
MSKITLTVAEIRRPAEGKERGNIIGQDGTKLGCFREKLSLFAIGNAYEIEISDGDYKNVKSAKLLSAGNPQPQQAAAPSPAANGHSNGNGHYRQTDPLDAERMFVCATLTALIKAGEVKNDKTQLYHTTNMLRALWAHTFGNGGTFTASEAGQRPRLVAAE